MATNNADRLSAFMANTERNKILEQNQFLEDSYNRTNELINFSLAVNERQLEEYNNELLRVAAKDISEAKRQIDVEGAKVNISEGITAGASKGRQSQTFALKASEKLNKINNTINNVLVKASAQQEAQNRALEMQRIDALNRLKSNLISGPMAALQIQLASDEGYKQGYQQDKIKQSEEQSKLILEQAKL